MGEILVLQILSIEYLQKIISNEDLYINKKSFQKYICQSYTKIKKIPDYYINAQCTHKNM